MAQKPMYRIGESHQISLVVLQVGFYFSEGNSAKWIFDVEIERLCAEIFFMSRRSKSCLVLMGKS
jgi:hypothetical protein